MRLARVGRGSSAAGTRIADIIPSCGKVSGRKGAFYGARQSSQIFLKKLFSLTSRFNSHLQIDAGASEQKGSKIPGPPVDYLGPTISRADNLLALLVQPSQPC